MTRIVDWLADGRSLVTGKPLHVVLNQHPSSSFVATEIEAELRRTVSPQSITLVPFDKRVLRASWDGEVVPRGPFTKAVAKLSNVVPLFGVEAK